ncbi:MAG TPA: hypothetical protein VMT15_12650 [Bryobacteraceae bacterium]|nr:hypothetical protein [Bryobacteraceae bacterium]
MLAALLLPSLLAGGAEPPADAVSLTEPKVLYRPNEASATRAPWIQANGWRLLRSPDRTFVYRAKGDAAALSTAEAFTYGAKALISADPPGEEAFGRMLGFLKTLPEVDLSPVADFGVIDDRTDVSGELLNLLTRSNLLFRLEKAPDPAFAINVRVGSKDYPLEEARNPSVLAHRIRAQIGDDNRSLRVYGSETVVARLLASGNQARVLLLNYSSRPVMGLRVRVKGSYGKGELRVFGLESAQLTDWTADGPATEFTIPEFRTFAVIDLPRN